LPFALDTRLTSYGDAGFSRFLRRAFLASSGFDGEDLKRPIVGIVDTSSDFTPCHRMVPAIVSAVSRGVSEAGGVPLVFGTMSLGETLITPTAMMFRNLMAMETEELIRAQPMDAVVLVGGCDKTVPAQLMAAVSADVPAIMIVTGPMLTGSWRGKRVGACTDCRSYWAEHRAGVYNENEIQDLRGALCPTGGTCMVMGTASTMACLAEVLGMMLPAAGTAPSPSGERLRLAVATGRRSVALGIGDIRPTRILTRVAFENAITTLVALGGSTNAIIHLTAIARRAGILLNLDDFRARADEVPVLADLKPAGNGYLEDFHYAGGVSTLVRQLGDQIDLSTVGVTGETLGMIVGNAPPPQAANGVDGVIRTLDDPVKLKGSIVVLKGSLAPNGAVLKAGAATPALLRHRGPALVFESPEEASQRLNDVNLEVTADHVVVLRNAGLVGAGMPEAGALPIPRRLVEQGVRDMVRISDARMSGTAYGTVVLHCSPEAAVGGPIALVKDGDLIELDAANGRLELLVSEEEIVERAKSLTPPELPERGWRRLFAQHVLPPELGADLDFLAPHLESASSSLARTRTRT
jgi:dihydroxy-acid dehydratase